MTSLQISTSCINMQSVQIAIMQKIIKMLTPTSPAYNNSLAFERSPTPQDVELLLQPGDIIFSRTNSNIYQAARKYMGINYDHVAVVLSNKQVIHISPPIISKLDLAYIIDPKREPMIIRPKVQDFDKYLLVINNYLGQKYNIAAIGQMGLRELKGKLKQQHKNAFSIANLKHSRICSDSILYALTRASPSIELSLQEQIKKTKYQQLGFFLPDQVANILMNNHCEIILKSKFQSDYKLVDICSKGGQKLIQGTQKIIDTSSFFNSKIKQKINKYKTKHPTQDKPQSKLTGIQIISLLLGLGHTLGVLTLTNTTRYMMLMLNMIIILGHYQEMKIYFNKTSPNL